MYVAHLNDSGAASSQAFDLVNPMKLGFDLLQDLMESKDSYFSKLHKAAFIGRTVEVHRRASIVRSELSLFELARR